MTDRELYLLLRRQAARLEPDLAREILRAFEQLRRQLSEAELERLIRTTNIDRILSETLDQDVIEDAFARFRVELQRTLQSATTSSARIVPGLNAPAVVFDVLNPVVIDALRVLDSRVMRGIQDSVRETFRLEVERGFEAGLGPRAIARRVRQTLALAPNQADAVANFRRMLEAGDREALTRLLRDRRFDRTLQRALGTRGTGLSADQVNRMVAAYERRMIAFNAETHARTAALDALKSGQRLGWEQAIAKGIVSRVLMRKRWANVGDSRVRPEHRDPPEGVNGEVVGFDEPFSNGQIIPGETDYNCRCIAVYFQAKAALAA